MRYYIKCKLNPGEKQRLTEAIKWRPRVMYLSSFSFPDSAPFGSVIILPLRFIQWKFPNFDRYDLFNTAGL
jgi:hypothetical protein